jgi:uncharacterized protein (DUF1800 family)
LAKRPLLKTVGTCALICATFLGCGRSDTSNDDVHHNSTGQVSNQAKANISYYAAARFAEQVSFGATPELIEEIQKLGFEGWIDAQFALPATTGSMPRDIMIATSDVTEKMRIEQKQGVFRADNFWSTALTAPDQLRQRVAWSIFQYIPVSQGAVNGSLEYYNMLRKNAFGNYADLLRDVTIHPAMGVYLNNEQNRPNSPECLGCTPNENYARELMQLFSVGVVQLNADGTTVRDAQRKVKETYTQKDVEELARALTGWTAPPNTTGLSGQYWPHFNQPMVPESQAFLHDSGQKTVMGNVLKAGMSAPEELNAVVAMLMKHQNVAPFVSLRLIQHLVMSNPSPQYLSRISAKFQNNGKGVAGDLRTVVKAILLDPEARIADQINVGDKNNGKLREPILWQTAVYRGMGCKRMTHGIWQGIEYVDGVSNQDPVNIPSIFSFYQATDLAPGSNLLAPEQKLLNTVAFTDRLGTLNWRFADPNNPTYQENLSKTACNMNELSMAFKASPSAYLDLVSKRWFRGAMPTTLRNNLLSLIQGDSWGTPEQRALSVLQFALTSPSFGVIK